MLRLFNTLTKTSDEVRPIEPGVVKMYTCGPTVYRDAHIGNLRSYLMADWIRRALLAQDLQVVHIKNITDVGHMRQEVLERGEDKVVAAALAEGKTAEEIAQFYTDRFLSDEKKVNIMPAHEFPKATDHIEGMVEIVEELIRKGLAYEVQGNVYYEVSSFPDYGQLSGNINEAELLEAVRVDVDPLKRDARDFTLWKQAEPGRILKWSSPWGDGFPGWHIECSAMSIKYLGKKFDLHTGGVDNIFPHHEGEIAQSEGFTGEPVVNIWTHGQHLLADGVKMSKSMGNSFILSDIEAQGIDPLAFRYLCLTAKYNTRLNFTFSSLKAAQRGLLRLRNMAWQWSMLPSQNGQNESDITEWYGKFMDRVNDNLDLPGALALTWEMARSDMPGQAKLAAMKRFDAILGMDLDSAERTYKVPQEVHSQISDRSDKRTKDDYQNADAIRSALSEDGYVVQDSQGDTRVRPKTDWEKREEAWHSFSSSVEVPSLVDEPDATELTIGMVACNYLGDVQRCLESALNWVGERPLEVLIVDNGSADGTDKWLEEKAATEPRLRVIHTDHVLGEGAAKNILLKQARGKTVVMLDTSVEISGDIFGPIDDALGDSTIGVTGPFGLRTNDLHHFHDGEGESGFMDAMQAYCFAFRRSRLKDVGLPRETFRFYRNLDLDYSFQFKDKGYKIVADSSLPVQLHEHRVWSALAEGERDELSKKNYRRFLDKWGDRADLLISSDHDHSHHTH
ncbi:MAG: cysteine--tRNA ligase [SAR202 cluster bacterium Casp-Chloro-G4]|nr:cysteine--tRNA ligase [Chloroflexota bacterium]PKB61290.1 MAG: cysteine--tRNA ligase [SAR202 cluster bacterium Casp-Chloro-G4]